MDQDSSQNPAPATLHVVCAVSSTGHIDARIGVTVKGIFSVRGSTGKPQSWLSSVDGDRLVCSHAGALHSCAIEELHEDINPFVGTETEVRHGVVSTKIDVG
jgi:hypothetical protein